MTEYIPKSTGEVPQNKKIKQKNGKKFKTLLTQALISAFALIAFSAPQGTYAMWPFSVSYSIKDLEKSAYEQYAGSSSQTLHYPAGAFLKSRLSPKSASAKGGAKLSIEDEFALRPQNSLSKDVTKNALGTISVYTVKKGDTLSDIAKIYGVSVNTIRWANDLGKDGIIRPGQELIILPADGVRYTVKRGGTLRDIIKKIGGNLEEASEINGIDPDKELKKGTVVIVPGAKLKEESRRVAKLYSSVKISSSYFIPPLKHYVRTQGLHGHNAVDMAAPLGTPVRAAASGRVIISRTGWNGGYGTYIVIQHPNGTQTLYAHNIKNYVVKGQWVNKGDIIAALGSTGRSTGPHIHFEVRGARNPF